MYMYVCIYVCMYVCMYECMYVCMYVIYIYIYMYTHTDTHTQTHTHTHTETHTHDIQLPYTQNMIYIYHTHIYTSSIYFFPPKRIDNCLLRNITHMCVYVRKSLPPPLPLPHLSLSSAAPSVPPRHWKPYYPLRFRLRDPLLPQGRSCSALQRLDPYVRICVYIRVYVRNM
jgi:hypothetical protein